jgi:hypothetical protein
MLISWILQVKVATQPHGAETDGFPVEQQSAPWM